MSNESNWLMDNQQRAPASVDSTAAVAQTDYEFTTDWFSWHVDIWKTIFSQTGIVPSNVLEIGCYEGRSTVWIMENLMAGRDSLLVAVDAWSGADEAEQRRMAEVEARFDRNIAIASRRQPAVRVEKAKGKSVDSLSALLSQGRKNSFDFIYVDGSHKASDVLSDLVLAFYLCRAGGLIFCDDYLWEMSNDLPEAPKLAIDNFVACFHRKLRIIPERNYQLYLQKTTE